MVREESGLGYYHTFIPFFQCYLLTETTNHVCLGMGEFIGSIANIYLTDGNGQSLYKTSKDGLFPFGVGSTVPAHFPHLRGTYVSYNQI
jgi:hypothetical protein